jgi:hypothetical protein
MSVCGDILKLPTLDADLRNSRLKVMRQLDVTLRYIKKNHTEAIWQREAGRSKKTDKSQSGELVKLPNVAHDGHGRPVYPIAVMSMAYISDF